MLGAVVQPVATLQLSLYVNSYNLEDHQNYKVLSDKSESVCLLISQKIKLW
jgi:hypothetical protein